MPEVEVRAAAEKLRRDRMSRYLLPKLTSRFCVSRAAMRVRLAGLGLLESSRQACQHDGIAVAPLPPPSAEATRSGSGGQALAPG